MTDSAAPNEIAPAILEAVVEFLRSWLPESAKDAYRKMMASDPENWRHHPHFAGGVIVDHVLRGNGLTEEALGVVDLDAVWPHLLELAVSEPDAGADTTLGRTD